MPWLRQLAAGLGLTVVVLMAARGLVDRRPDERRRLLKLAAGEWRSAGSCAGLSERRTWLGHSKLSAGETTNVYDTFGSLVGTESFCSMPDCGDPTSVMGFITALLARGYAIQGAPVRDFCLEALVERQEFALTGFDVQASTGQRTRVDGELARTSETAFTIADPSGNPDCALIFEYQHAEWAQVVTLEARTNFKGRRQQLDAKGCGHAAPALGDRVVPRLEVPEAR